MKRLLLATIVVLTITGCVTHNDVMRTPSMPDFPAHLKEACMYWLNDSEEAIDLTLRCAGKWSEKYPVGAFIGTEWIEFRYLLDKNSPHEPILKVVFHLGKVHPQHKTPWLQKPKNDVAIEYQFDDLPIQTDKLDEPFSSHVRYGKEINTAELYDFLDNLKDSDTLRFKIDGEKEYTIRLTGSKRDIDLFRDRYQEISVKESLYPRTNR